MLNKIKTRIKRSQGGGIFHNSRQDVETLTSICNELISKVNELVDEINKLKEKE